MNNIEKIYKKSKNIGEFAAGYFGYLKNVLNSLDPISLKQLSDEFEDSREKGSTIFVAGNGGSAATATTMANDIGFDKDYHYDSNLRCIEPPHYPAIEYDNDLNEIDVKLTINKYIK